MSPGAGAIMAVMRAAYDPAPDPRGSDGSAVEPGPTSGPPHRRPWAWIAVCGVLVLALVGLTIWALNLNSDLDQQRDATAQAQQEADQANDQADQLSSQLDDLAQSASDAGDEIAQAGSDAKETFQNALADLKAKLSSLADQIKPPASGSGTPDATATPIATVETPQPTAASPEEAPSGGAAATDTATPVETATP